MNALDTRKAIQAMLAVTPDGDFGKLTRSALATLAAAQDDAPWPPLASAPSQDVSSGIHHVKASSFADRGDVAAFQRCRDRGNSEQFCFSKGDNGQGFGGLTDCTDETIPYVALPPDYWKPRFGTRENAIGKPVVVSIGNQTFVCKIGDTMPELRHIENGAGIDLAPGAQKLFGLTAPFMVDATWAWG